MSATNSLPHVAIILLNWNQPDDTLACLESLAGSDYPAAEVIVVDNGSANGSPALIRRRFPRITVVENGRNLGFAGGNNVGIALAVARGAQYVLLLNNDTEVAADMVRVLVEVGEGCPNVGIVGPKIYYYHQPNVIWSAGGVVSKYGQAAHLRAEEFDDGRPEVVTDVDYVTGCALLIKSSVIAKVGMLDERFFAYFEEAEWCARVRRAGFRVLYVPQAHLWHKIRPAARNYSRRYLYLMARNRLLYLKSIGAKPLTVLLASLDLLRTATSWSVRPRHKDLREFSSTLVLATYDFFTGRFGAPPSGL